MIDLFLDERIAPSSPKLLNLRQIGVDHAINYNKLWHSRLPETVKGNLLRNRHYIFMVQNILTTVLVLQFGLPLWQITG